MAGAAHFPVVCSGKGPLQTNRAIAGVLDAPVFGLQQQADRLRQVEVVLNQ